ncbi:MAG: hypothetical protein M0R37_12580 [Bacteroidales bacterium]|nr:hypothetical protein [Bacteroidales bacterium]
MIDHPIAFIVLVAVGFLVGAILVAAIARVRSAESKRHGCSLAAMRLRHYFGNPAIHATMHGQFRAGHRFDMDREFEQLLEQMLRRAFDVEERAPRA